MYIIFIWGVVKNYDFDFKQDLQKIQTDLWLLF